MLELHWSDAPLIARLFLVYVGLTIPLAIIRALRLTWRFFTVRGGRMSIMDLRANSINPDSFAQAALANRLRYEPTQEGTPNKSRNPVGDQVVLQALQIADSKFRYLAGVSETKIASIKRLLWLTVLLSMLVLTFDSFTMWRDFYEEAKVTGLFAWFQTIRILFDWLSIALGGCVILFIISSFLEGTLLRRQVCWQYFYSRTSIDLSIDDRKSDRGES
jgi:hypothetical protein